MSSTIIIRTPRPDEAFAVRRLAYLDSQRPLRGDVLVAQVENDLLAAISLTEGRVVADPFTHTADVVELLRMRAARHAPTASSIPAPRRLAARAACRTPARARGSPAPSGAGYRAAAAGVSRPRGARGQRARGPPRESRARRVPARAPA